MATEHQTLDAPGNNCDDAQPSMLERGNQLLRTLQHAARAARLEAQVVELQSALEQAREGDLRTLQRCLDQFEQPQSYAYDRAIQPGVASQTESLAHPSEPYSSEALVVELHSSATHLGKTTTTETHTSELDGALGWSVYLKFARQRLEKLDSRNDLPWGDADSELDSEYQAPGTDAQIAIDVPTCDVQAKVELSEECRQRLGIDGFNDGLNDGLNESPRAGLIAAPSMPLGKRLFGSYGLSMAGHAIVLVILGTITYKSPDDGNSLGSQVLSAAEARSETELTSQVEMVEPSEVQIVDSTVEPSVDPTAATVLASELSQLASTVSHTVVDVSTPGSAGASIASSISESAGKSSPGPRGSGIPSMSGSFFGVGTGGNYFCYVVDSSGSMRGGAWESAKSELVRSLKSLKQTQKFYIVFFADDFEALPEPGTDRPAASGLYATPENIEHARRWIASVELNRGGPPTEALAWAIEREPDAIYLLTDGVTKVDVCGFLRKANRIEDIVSGSQVRVPIHAIAYFSLDGQQLMRQLAKENLGQFIYVPKPKK